MLRQRPIITQEPKPQCPKCHSLELIDCAEGFYSCKDCGFFAFLGQFPPMDISTETICAKKICSQCGLEMTYNEEMNAWVCLTCGEAI